MKNALTPLRRFQNWGRHVARLASIIARVAPDAEVYLAGGAAEDRLTVVSDIDVVIVLPREPSLKEAIDLHEKIIEEMEKSGIPPYIPVELHIIGPKRLKRYKKLVKILNSWS